MSGWIDMKRIGPMLLLAMALNGCAGPTSRQTGLLLSHMSIAVAVCAYVVFWGLDPFLRKVRPGAPIARGWVVLLQLVVWMSISGLVSMYLFSHHSRAHFQVFSMRPRSEWLRLQLFSVLYLPAVISYSLLFAWLVHLTGRRRLREFCLTGTMLAHGVLCGWLIVK